MIPSWFKPRMELSHRGRAYLKLRTILIRLSLAVNAQVIAVCRRTVLSGGAIHALTPTKASQSMNRTQSASDLRCELTPMMPREDGEMLLWV
jgi:hypothetical protein